MCLGSEICNNSAKIRENRHPTSIMKIPAVKLPAHRAGLPGHAVASRMRANEISFFIVPLDPAYKAGLAGHLPVSVGAFSLEELKRSPWSGHFGVMGHGKQPWQDTGYIGYFKETVGGAGSRPENIGGRENVRLGIKRMDLSSLVNKVGDL